MSKGHLTTLMAVSGACFGTSVDLLTNDLAAACFVSLGTFAALFSIIAAMRP